MAIKIQRRPLPITRLTSLAMLSRALLSLTILLSANGWSEDEGARDKHRAEMQGISIIGDKESPTVLNFVPWKSPKNLNMITIDIPPIDTLGPIQRKSLRREINYFYQHQAASSENVKNPSP